MPSRFGGRGGMEGGLVEVGDGRAGLARLELGDGGKQVELGSGVGVIEDHLLYRSWSGE